METPDASAPPAPRTYRMPDSYIIIFFVIALAALMTYWIPAGVFDVKTVEYEVQGHTQTKTVPIAESFRIAEDENGEPLYINVSLFSGEAHSGAERIHRFPSDANGNIGFFNYAFEGMTSGSKYGAAVGVIAFILVIGGAFGIILRTSALETGILYVIHRAKGSDKLLIPVLFVLFSLGGAIFGMSEEAIAFAMIVVPLLIAMGYDSITGVLVTYVATQVGFAASWMNPFNVGVAQGLAGIPVLSGAGFRIIMWLVFTAAALVFVVLYARRIQRNPQKSITYESDAFFREKDEAAELKHVQFGLGHALVLATFALGIVWVIWGVIRYQYYIPEIATQFFIIGVLAGVIGAIFRLDGMGFNDIAVSFRRGAGDLLGAALIVGMAKGIILVLGGDNPADPTVLNTILNWAGNVIGPLPDTVSALAMLVFQSGLNFFVPSGSGQAALTVPLMAPLADFAGLSRQVAVLAFQLGDGLTNLIIPTSAALMGTLAVARIDYMKWLRFMLPLQLVLVVLAAVFVIIAIAIGFA